MASPQKENGYTAIANELMDALSRTSMASSERQVLDCVIRKTYGFNKKEDSISLSQFVEATGMKKRMVIYAIQNLEAKGIILVTHHGLSPNSYSVQKDYDRWVVQRNAAQYDEMLKARREKYQIGVVQRNRSSATKPAKAVQRRDKKGHFVAHTKDNSNKAINTVGRADGQKKPKSEAYLNPDPLSLEEFIRSMRESPQRRLNILAEYADEIRPDKHTKGQWREFIDRNISAAARLSGYQDDQIAIAMKKIQANLKTPKNPKGYITKWSLETVLKYID